MSRKRFYRPSFERLEDRLYLATWPVPVSHEMQNGFGAGTPANPSKFHEGIDIRAGGNGGEDVVAARGGVLFWNNPDYVGGMLIIEVDLGDGNKEYDRYLHLDVAGVALPARFGTIDEGDPIGKISSDPNLFAAGARHIHFAVVSAPPPFEGAPDEATLLNPFLRFEQNADRDPLGNKPELKDSNGDDATLVITPNGNPAAPFDKQPISRDVDIIADVRDSMSTDLAFVTNPYIVGYWVKPLFALAHGVKTAANPYRLVKFDDDWFKGYDDEHSNHVKTSTKFAEVYDTTRPADVGTFPYQRLNHFIVTNTKGENGKIANVHANQYWNTDAKDDGSGSDVAHANFAGKPDAGGNGEARFIDGEYEIHIVLGDVVHQNEDIVAGKVRVVNFERKAENEMGGIAPPGGSPIQLRHLDDVPYVPPLIPQPVIADTEPLYTYGDVIGVRGEEFYPNFALYAYVVPHRESGWMENDSIASEAIATVIVGSDAGGVVPLTQAWQADILNGEFDIIIDYDNDGLFTWKLDAITGFTVQTMVGTEPDYHEVGSNRNDYLEVLAPGVLLNDYHVDAAELVPQSGPAHGQLIFNEDGSFSYVADPGYEGIDTFQYVGIHTPSGYVTPPETVTINVTYMEPAAIDDEYWLELDSYSSLVVPAPGVLANESYADVAQVVPGTGPSSGSLNLNSDGSFTYTPFSPFNGTDSFQYVAIDSYTSYTSQPATVTINVSCMWACQPLKLDQPAIESDAPLLAMGQLEPIADAARQRWRQAGVSEETLEARLASVRLVIADLPGNQLAGAHASGVIFVDINAAGHGWFIDASPADDREFSRSTGESEMKAGRNSPAYNAVDLLTAVMHEFGHLFGLDHAEAGSGNIMEETLGLGTRRVPTDIDAATADYLFFLWQTEQERRAA